VIAFFVWVVDTLAKVRRGQVEILRRLDEIERTRMPPSVRPLHTEEPTMDPRRLLE
jgi:hypothetical protein